METWQVDLLKIGLTAVVFFLIGLGSHWYRSRTRFNEYLKKRQIEKVPEKEYLKEVEKITNILLTYKEHGITPKEYQKFKDKMLPQISEYKSETPISEELVKSKEEFLRRAYGYRHRAYILLLMTVSFQTAIREHRIFEPSDFAEGNTMDEKIPNMIKRILDNGLDTVIPIRIIDEKSGETRSVITPEIIEGLNQINSLLDLYKRIENNETELPSRLDIDNLFDKIGDALTTLVAGLEIVGTHSILYQHRMESAIKALEKEIEQAEAEQRPIRLPPPHSA